MDLATACALTMCCRNNRVQEIMLTMYKDEAKTFARNNSLFFLDIIQVPPMNRCRERRGRGRCRGAPSELALTQMCAYHQERRTGDLNVNCLRCLASADPLFFRVVSTRLDICKTVRETNKFTGSPKNRNRYLHAFMMYVCACLLTYSPQHSKLKLQTI